MRPECILRAAFPALQILLQSFVFPVAGHSLPPPDYLWGSEILAHRLPASGNEKDVSAWDDDGRPVYMYAQQDPTKGDRVEKLPGQPQGVDFDQYSGYVTVDPKAGRSLFYYFVESPEADRVSHQKPLVLWLSGGPGCSSVGIGAMMEIGPFRVRRDGKTLKRNVFSWINVANIIFLESPAGVGFSYSSRMSDITRPGGDRRTAKDSYTFLVNWLERFPRYKGRDLYIAGESYSGHYVPQLAHLILRNNKISGRPVINLRGIAVGNGFLGSDKPFVRGMIDYLHERSLISDEVHGGLLRTCISSSPEAGETCASSIATAYRLIGRINLFQIYSPMCDKSTTSAGPPTTNVSQESDGVDPCAEVHITAYMNDRTVQEALHARPTSWESCSPAIRGNWSKEDMATPMLPVLKKLMDGGLRVWIYSGDADAIVPVTGTKYGIKELKLPVETPWYAWYSRGEVGGYAVGYKGLVFATVRGGGHEVPMYQPAKMLTLFSSFLEGKLPPGA